MSQAVILPIGAYSEISGAGGNVAFVLPASSLSLNSLYYYKRTDGPADSGFRVEVQVSGNTSDTIDGQTSILLAPLECVQIYCASAGVFRVVGRS